MDRSVPWKSAVENCGAWLRNTGSPAGFNPRRCQKRAQRCSRNSIFGTAKQKAIQGVQGIEGKAIDVWMDRPVPWKSPVEQRGHGCETPDQPQGGARSVCRDALEKA